LRRRNNRFLLLFSSKSLPWFFNILRWLHISRHIFWSFFLFQRCTSSCIFDKTDHRTNYVRYRSFLLWWFLWIEIFLLPTLMNSLKCRFKILLLSIDFWINIFSTRYNEFKFCSFLFKNWILQNFKNRRPFGWIFLKTLRNYIY